MATRPARDPSPEEAARDHAHQINGWVTGALASLIAPTLLIAAGIGALAGIRPATSAPAAAVTLDSSEQQFLSLINEYRGGQGLPTLALDPQLEAASRWMSADMATNDYFSHYDSLGRDPFQRMAASGYDYNVWKGENLAAGTASAQVAFDLWKASPGHNSNMTNPNFVGIGIARAYGPDSGLGWYWTTDFGGLANGEPPPNPTNSPAPAAASLTPTPTPTPPPPSTPTARPTPTATASPPRESGPTPSALGDQNPCGTNTSPPTKPPSPIGWPADLAGTTPDSLGFVTLQDITSFVVPTRYLGTNLGTHPADYRRDLVPGAGIFATDINLQDLTNLTTLKPRMFGTVNAFLGPGCPTP